MWPSCLKSTDIRRGLVWACAWTLIGSLAACTVVGPAGIRSGRGDYSSAINATNDQQTLKSIVHIRYGESSTMLKVSSVTANMKFASRGSFDIGVGPDENFAGNLVPLSGSVLYEENPTISYIPLDGGKFVRELLSPIPLRLYLLLVESGDFELTARMLTNSVNRLRNPDFLAGNEAETDGRFDRFIEILASLDRRDRLDFGKIKGKEDEVAAVIHGYAPDQVDEVNELLALLGLRAMKADGQDVLIPIYLSVGSQKPKSVKVRTRSIYDVMRIAAASAEVPEEHAESGLALTYPQVGWGRELLRIRSSKSAPDNAAVAIQHHDYWFYIDATDRSSRLSFLIIQTLISVRIADVAGGAQSVPLITVPASN